ncbi:MAG: hypothetical protein ACOYOT_00485 [Bacteroidales bacterium]
MDAIEFVMNYEKFIGEIEQVIQPELLPIFQKLKDIDPYDLIKPDDWFVTTNQARGFVPNRMYPKMKMIRKTASVKCNYAST